MHSLLLERFSENLCVAVRVRLRPHFNMPPSVQDSSALSVIGARSFTLLFTMLTFLSALAPSSVERETVLACLKIQRLCAYIYMLLSNNFHFAHILTCLSDDGALMLLGNDGFWLSPPHGAACRCRSMGPTTFPNL